METNNQPTRKTPSTSETGHLKNVTNFERLIAYCTALGSDYNPSNPNLALAQLSQLHVLASKELTGYQTLKNNLNVAVNNRRSLFTDLKSLSTKVVNAFAVSGADQLAVQNLKTLNNKMQNYHRKSSPADANTKTISTSQQSYDRQIDHFANMIILLEQNSNYQPNETQLQVQTLHNKLTALKATNTELINAQTAYQNGLIHRNQLFYNTTNGLVKTALDVKLYIKSLYSATAPQYTQVASIEFKNIRA